MSELESAALMEPGSDLLAQAGDYFFPGGAGTSFLSAFLHLGCAVTPHKFAQARNVAMAAMQWMRRYLLKPPSSLYRPDDRLIAFHHLLFCHSLYHVPSFPRVFFVATQSST